MLINVDNINHVKNACIRCSYYNVANNRQIITIANILDMYIIILMPRYIAIAIALIQKKPLALGFIGLDTFTFLYSFNMLHCSVLRFCYVAVANHCL